MEVKEGNLAGCWVLKVLEHLIGLTFFFRKDLYISNF